MEPSAVVVVVAAALLASVAQGVTGFGFALVAVPFFLLVLDVQEAVVVSSILATLSVGLLAIGVWREVPWRTVWVLLLGSLVGMPAGLAVLLLAPDDELRVGMGLAVIVMAALLAAGWRLSSGGVGGQLVAGVASGVLRTSTSMAGPPVVLYLQASGHAPLQFRAALVMFFLLGNLLAIVAFAASRALTGDALALSAIAAPAVYLGVQGGGRLLHRIEPHIFRRLVLLLLTTTALAGVISSLYRLAG